MNICASYACWWRWWDSNPWPPACRAGALPAELHPHKVVVFSNFRGKRIWASPVISAWLISRNFACTLPFNSASLQLNFFASLLRLFSLEESTRSLCWDFLSSHPLSGLLVGPSGLEPPTSCLSGTRSNLLSYEPIWLEVFLLHLVCSVESRFLCSLTVLALSYLPVPLPAKYFHHCRA